jgi:hypothetical protein
MKLTEAVGILNACRHRDGDDWIIDGLGAPNHESLHVVRSTISDNLTAFEAIAVAEKYKEGETPDSIIHDLPYQSRSKTLG